MKLKLQKKIFAFILIVMSAICLAGCGNGTAFVINGEEVPQAVVDYYITAGKSSLAYYGLDVESDAAKDYLPMIEQQAVNTAEQFGMVRAGAKERNLEVTSEEVDEEFEIEKEAFTSEDDYNAFLEENDLSESTIKWIIESQLYYQKLFDELNKDVTATDEELQKAYQENPAAYDSVNVSYILIQPENQKDDGTWEDADWANAEAKAKEAIEKLNGGADFAEVAKEYSDDPSTAETGGVLPDAFTAESETLDADFVAASFKIEEVGQYTTAPVKSDSFGYFIIKLDDKKAGWENLKEELEDSLLGAQKDENFNKFMEDAMANAVYDKEYKYQYVTEEPADDATEEADVNADAQSGDAPTDEENKAE